MAITKKPRLLLHICCAGCGAYVSNLLEQNFEPFLYFQNSNIFPEAEFIKRKDEVERIARHYDLPYLIEDYDHGKWLAQISGYEKEKEKGQRCYLCYLGRMEEAIKKAKELEMDYFSTTLSVSPYKVYSYIKEIGELLSEKYGLKFHDQDFKKQDGYKKASELSRSLDLYRQNYCGCEFSVRS